MSRPDEQQQSSRSMRLVVVGIVLAVLLGIVALVARGHESPAGSSSADRGASQGLANIVFTLWILAMIAGALLLAYTLSLKKRDRTRGEFRIKPLLFGLLFFGAVVIGLVFAYGQLGDQANRRPRVPPTALGNQHLKKGDRKKLEKALNPHSPSFNWEIAAGVFALIFALGATALIASHRRRSKLIRETTVAQEIMEMLDETLDDLRNETDPRKAVIAAYARMEKILAANDLPRQASEAPLEYLERVLIELRVTEEAVTKLTALFQRAKFSEHQIGPEAKGEAIDALVTLRDQLRVLNEPKDRPDLPTRTAQELRWMRQFGRIRSPQ
jgi:heme/copper-type cytochrome/quinol oxidase subunit 4